MESGADRDHEDTDAGEAQDTPRQATLKQASMLTRQKRAHEALDLLLKKRDSKRRVRPALIAAIAGLQSRLGQHAEAVENFDRALGDDFSLTPKLRSIFVKSLLALYQVERAGKLLTEMTSYKKGAGRPIKLRPAQEAAIAAFEAMQGDAPDKGPPTPFRILAHAEILAEQKAPEAALSLLRDHQDNWSPLPPRYKRLVGLLARKTEESGERIDRLLRKHDESDTPMTADQHLKLGTRLFDGGRFEDGARALAAAVEQGAEVDRRDLGMAVDLYLRRHGKPEGYDTSFGRSYTLINPEKRLVYVPINKNACTFLKTNFILNSPHRDAYLQAKEFIHQFCDGLPKAKSRSEFLQPDYVRFTVLREPGRRLVSAYLNKLVQQRFLDEPFGRLMLREHAIRRAQDLAGVPYDLDRSLTFEEFVHFIVTVEDYELNRHWLPQYRFVGTDLSRYHHVGKLEKLQDTLDWLKERFDFTIQTEREGKATPIGGVRYQRKYAEAAPLEAPHQALPVVLDRYEDNMPSADLFYTPELRRLVEQRFAEDFAIYRAI